MENKAGKVYFIFGVHNHQPVGNLAYVFDQAFQRCYLPFLSALEQFPAMKAVIHNSGALYDWAEDKFPAWIEKLKKLIKRNQVELTGGGYFEPIFPIIPQTDRIGQLQLMNHYLEKTFKVKPKGCWIPERVWEPSLAKTLRQCGFEYTYLDEANLFCLNIDSKGFSRGVYLTEDQGEPVALFAINELLSDKIPFIMPEEVVDLLLSCKRERDVLVTFFCDGEKFGFWPKTYESVYRQKWLERLFKLLEKNCQIETILPQQAWERFEKKLIYVKTSTYPKMADWAFDSKKRKLKAELVAFLKESGKYHDYKEFLRGESFKNFFIKYPRLNLMHKKMLWVSKRINSLLSFDQDKEAFINLWKAQANCPYWHGLFGGFYLPHLRKACYDYLIKAEAYLNEKVENKGFTVEDIDCDGFSEVVFSSENLNCLFSVKGGTLDELSLPCIPHNLINTVERAEEACHFESKELSRAGLLNYDRCKKTFLVDHILAKGIKLSDFKKGQGIQSLAAFPYEFRIKEKAGVLEFGYKGRGLAFKKEVSIGKKQLKAGYVLTEKKALNNSCFGIECNLSLSSSGCLEVKGREEKSLDFSKEQDLGELDFLTIIDKNYKLKLKFAFSFCRVYANPIYTLSSSEAGQDVLFQQLSLLFVLNPEMNSFSFGLNIESLR